MKKLIRSVTRKDLDVQTFSTGGHGGQNVNKREMGVRIVHKESGAVGESREERSQIQNKRIALHRLAKHLKFKVWLARIAAEQRKGRTVEQAVEDAMLKNNLRFEIRDETGRWKETDDVSADEEEGATND